MDARNWYSPGKGLAIVVFILMISQEVFLRCKKSVKKVQREF